MRFALVVLLGLGPAAALADDKGFLSIAPPATIVDLDLDKLKGRPARLAWSEDRLELYVQTVEGSTVQDVKYHHYLIRVPDESVERLSGEPEWAGAFWKWKSAKRSPMPAGMEIEVDSGSKSEKVPNQSLREKASSGTAGDGGRMLGGTALAVEFQSITTSVGRLLLKGEVIGSWTGAPIVPGMTFGWSPGELGLIAFVDPAGRLSVMNAQGRRQSVPETKETLLPAWSDDGTQIAFLERTGRKTYALNVITVSLR